MAKKIILPVLAVMLFGTWTYADECNTLRYSDNNDGTVTDGKADPPSRHIIGL